MREMVQRGVPLEHFETVRTPVEEIFVRTVQRGDAARAGGASPAGERP
jgi:hypothetical protein